MQALAIRQEGMAPAGTEGFPMPSRNPLAELPPAVVLVDVALSTRAELLAELRLATASGWIAIAMGSEAAPDDVLAVLRAGAAGYVTKDMPGAAWASCIHAAARGEAPLSRALTSLLVDYFRRQAAAAPGHSLLPSATRLTRREWEILSHIASGLTNRAVAAELCISVETVRSHVSNILEKLDAPNRSAAAARYQELRALQAV
jgi:DNA-binding NarL/FixJ family response regulator